jgi:small Trp-rich protein
MRVDTQGRQPAEETVMVFLIVGVLLVLARLADVGFVAGWSWWAILAPFGLALLWWGLSDSLGLTQRRAMEAMDAKKAERRERNLEALGMGSRRDRKARRAVAVEATGEADRRSAKDPTQVD